jgi:transposase
MAALKPEMADSWLMKLCRRRHKNIAAARGKDARMAWAMLIRNQAYQAGHVPARSSVMD